MIFWAAIEARVANAVYLAHAAPPAPSGDGIWRGPSFVPEVRAITAPIIVPGSHCSLWLLRRTSIFQLKQQLAAAGLHSGRAIAGSFAQSLQHGGSDFGVVARQVGESLESEGLHD
jgi:hypothetical protein